MNASLLPPLRDDELDGEARERIAGAIEFMGFDPNDARAMARVPGLLDAMAALVGACYGDGRVPIATKRLVAYVTSRAAGCRYCEAHTRFGALRAGIDPTTLAAVWNFETDERFGDADKAALRLAVAAATEAAPDLGELRQFFDADETAELLAVLSLFAFLNRWNLIAATTLEEAPRQSASFDSRA